MKIAFAGAALAALLGGPGARAQDTGTIPLPMTPGTQPPRKGLAPLKVRVVLSKLKDDKLTASLPYTLPCNAEDRLSNLRMGIELPVLVTSKEGQPAYQYRNVGTNIDCRATALDDGRFRLEMTVEHSAIHTAQGESSRAAMEGTPVFRTFRTAFVPLLRSGESLQYTTATDPVSGEVVKIDVTLTAMK